MRKKVFICSPFCGDMEGNAKKAAVYSRMACEEGYLPIAPHLLYGEFVRLVSARRYVCGMIKGEENIYFR